MWRSNFFAKRFTPAAALLCAGWWLPGGTCPGACAAESSALSDEPIPMKTEAELPPRTPPIVEIGQPFLGTGNIGEGFELPTGAVWQPSLWVFGDVRTAFDVFDTGDADTAGEWVTSTDLFLNLQLSGTERVLLGLTPLDRSNRYTGYTFEPNSDRGWRSELNAAVRTLFFEGEIGEIFPRLDPTDSGKYDVGFSVGRQLIEYQDGIMFTDFIDSVGITRDSIVLPGAVDTRLTFLYGWGHVDRNDNRRDSTAEVFGLFTESDLRRSTVALDFAYVPGSASRSGDGFYVGASAVQRIGLYNTTFRVNASTALDQESAAVSDGVLLFAELSRTLAYSDDIVYLNGFWGIDDYSSAARDPTTGGALGRTGLLFAAVDLGRYPAALDNRPNRAFGGILGHQIFINHRAQLTLEIGGRRGTDSAARELDAVAMGGRFQHSFGQRTVLQLDGFYAFQSGRDDGYGLRSELRVQF